MKKLILSALCLGFVVNVAMAGLPDTPLDNGDYTCTVSNTATFCGTPMPITSTQNNGCFEDVSVRGSQYAGSEPHQWGFIYTNLKVVSPTFACTAARAYCVDHYNAASCTTSYNTCKTYTTTFKSSCL